MKTMRKILLILGVVLVAAFGIGYLVLRDDQPPSPPDSGKPPGASALPYKPGKPLPTQAADIAQDLASSDASTQRAALTPELDQALATGRLLPEGTRIDLKKDSWHENNGYANAQATLTKPGKPAQHILIGFAKRSSGWRITVVEVVK
ncbi:hypothetical protein [Streptomyces albidoflavus]|uniref:hypothetical protein n=2 Tax=Streptomyces TaxID=1883 RepID=UPI0038B31131|nr:hypothetical protein OG794_29835 [Streptomyces albidoflavus]WTC06237.1 hypothetical protein OG794_30790 [Streptomyces albidoflavus]